MALFALRPVTITKALLNVIADAKTKVYGDADPSLTYQVSVDPWQSVSSGNTQLAVGAEVSSW